MNVNIERLAKLAIEIEATMKFPEGDWKGGIALGACRDQLREMVSEAGIHARYIEIGLEEIEKRKIDLAGAQTVAEHKQAKRALERVQKRYGISDESEYLRSKHDR